MKSIHFILIFLLYSCGGESSNIPPYTGITSIRIDQSQPDNEHNGIFQITSKRDRSNGGSRREMTARGVINGDFAELIVIYDRDSQQPPISVTWNRGGSQSSPQYTANCSTTSVKRCEETTINRRDFQFTFRLQQVNNTSPSNESRIYGEIYLFGGEIQ